MKEEILQLRTSAPMIELKQFEIEEIVNKIFGELQERFDMKRECLDLDKFEEVKKKWKIEI